MFVSGVHATDHAIAWWACTRRRRTETTSPCAPVLTIVGVDPSDSGQGDACGIVAASLTAYGVVVVHRDISAPMSPEAWARAAVELALDVAACEIAIETFTAREGCLSVVNNTLRRLSRASQGRSHLLATKGYRPRQR
jgi:phage terminase large subunit-like protein